MSETASHAVEAAVVFKCRGCGKSVVLTTTETGAQIDDVPTFLRVHARCLERLHSEKVIELPD